MKARVKATGEIVEAELKGFDNLNVEHYIINGNQNWVLSEFGLEFLALDPNPDYWTRLKHQAMIAAMPLANDIIDGLLGGDYHGTTERMHTIERFVEECDMIAHALVEKMKEEK